MDKKKELGKFSILNYKKNHQLDIVSCSYGDCPFHELGAEISMNKDLPWYRRLDMYLGYIFIPHYNEQDGFEFTLKKEDAKKLLETAKTYIPISQEPQTALPHSHGKALIDYFLSCECHTPSHLMTLTVNSDEKEIYISLHQSVCRGFFKRIKLVLSHIFSKKFDDWMYDTWMLNRNDHNGLIKVLEDFINDEEHTDE